MSKRYCKYDGIYNNSNRTFGMTLTAENNKIIDTIISTTSSTYLEKNRFILSNSEKLHLVFMSIHFLHFHLIIHAQLLTFIKSKHLYLCICLMEIMYKKMEHGI